MEIETFIESVLNDLQIVSTADESESAMLRRFTRALEPALRLRLLDALGQAALELSEHLPSGHVEVRVSGRDMSLVFVEPSTSKSPEQIEDEGGTARLTVRMPEALKARLEQASDREGISTNAWLVRAVQRGLDSTGPAGVRGRRISGFARS